MTRTGRTGGGRADCGGRADGRWTGRQADVEQRRGGRADGQTARRLEADERTSGRGRTMGGRADGATNGRTGWRTGGRRISEGKTPNLTRHLTWPWEIQRGRPWVTVKLPNLPPPSR